MRLNPAIACQLPNLSSRAQVASALGVCTKTLQRAEKRGEIQSIKINHTTVLYPIEQVIQYFEKLNSTLPKE